METPKITEKQYNNLTEVIEILEREAKKKLNDEVYSDFSTVCVDVKVALLSAKEGEVNDFSLRHAEHYRNKIGNKTAGCSGFIQKVLHGPIQSEEHQGIEYSNAVIDIMYIVQDQRRLNELHVDRDLSRSVQAIVAGSLLEGDFREENISPGR